MKSARKDIDHSRRRFFSATAMTLAASQLGALTSVKAGMLESMPASAAGRTSGGNVSLGPLKQIDAGILNVGYAEAGPGGGKPVVLLHGWPYDIHSFVDVAPILASQGYRLIVPYVRGYGTTRFLSSEVFRNGQPSAVALDTVADGRTQNSTSDLGRF